MSKLETQEQAVSANSLPEVFSNQQLFVPATGILALPHSNNRHGRRVPGLSFHLNNTQT
jgi:hypothetical protein